MKKAISMGYKFVAPPINYIKRMGLRNGYNSKETIKVEKELLNKQIIDFKWKKYL